MTDRPKHRFDYDHMSVAEFRRALNRLDMKLYAFARIFGVPPSRASKWYSGKDEVPVWVAIALELLAQPGALGRARMRAAALIAYDHHRPHLGEYPYAVNRDIPDDEEAHDAVC